MADHLWRHQLGAGIHPAAFVQPRPPDTSTIQDRTLWIDNSVNEPYPIFSWDAAAGLWRAVGRGAPGPPGQAATLPPGSDGDVMVYVRGQWVGLPPDQPGEVLTLAVLDQEVAPTWALGCCDQHKIDKIGNDPWTGGAGEPPDWGRCGAALAMAQWLEQYYANVIALFHIFQAVNDILSVKELMSKLVDAAYDIERGAWVDWVVKALPPLAGFLRRTFGLGANFDALTDEQKQWIHRAIYCCLANVSGPSAITSDTIACWGVGISRLFGITLLPSAQNLLNLLLLVPGLGTWQELATRGMAVTTNACVGFDCGAGNAMTGGAVLLVPGQTAMTGGAMLAAAGQMAMTGGATYNPARGLAMTGGASLS
jgi:hypothetical protein